MTRPAAPVLPPGISPEADTGPSAHAVFLLVVLIPTKRLERLYSLRFTERQKAGRPADQLAGCAPGSQFSRKFEHPCLAGFENNRQG